MQPKESSFSDNIHIITYKSYGYLRRLLRTSALWRHLRDIAYINVAIHYEDLPYSP